MSRAKLQYSRIFRKALPLSGVAFLLGFPCSARELLLLRSGGSLEALSHTLNADSIVLTTLTGTLAFPSAEVVDIQNIADLPAVAPLVKYPKGASDVLSTPDVLLSAAAREQGLEEALVRSVARVESGWRADAVSPKGAIGLMQLMPATATSLGVDAHDIKENADGGARYLRQLLLHYHGDAALALAAYNAGPAAVAKYRGIPPYAETRLYVLRVLREVGREQAESAALLRTAKVSPSTSATR